MNSWFRRATAALNADPVLKALTSAFSCGVAALIWTFSIVFMNDAVQHSMLRGRAYTEAALWVNLMIYADFALVFATLAFFIQSVRLARPSKVEPVAESSDWETDFDLEGVI